jgi:cyclophilin family peptidyl-prolyl cis-trans isomerase
MPPGASLPSSGGIPAPPGGTAAASGAGSSSTTPPPVPTQSVSRSMGRPESRSAHRAAKRAATGRPPAGTPGRPSRSSGTNWAIVGLAGAAVLVGAAVIAFGNPFGTPTPSGSAGASGSGSLSEYGDGTCPASPPAPMAAGEVSTVTIETELGDIVMRIDGALAPNATGNFKTLVECEYYDGLVFHRLVPGFVIQGGDPNGDGSGGPGYGIQDDPLVGEYRRGTVAMARTGQPNSQGSQFFIILSDDANAALTDPQNAPYPYAILGEVTSGMDVVDAIAAMPNSGGQENAALDPVVMTRVTVSTGTAPSASPAASPAPTASAAPITSPATSP